MTPEEWRRSPAPGHAGLATAAAQWIAHDPDPATAAELAACGPDELAARFAHPLTFGTAGLRGPVRGGPDAMNVAVVSRATWAVARVLDGRGLAGSPVIVGRDSRHGSAVFATVAAEVLAAQGFSVLLLPGPVPTPVVAFAVRHTGAAAGIQITASHNPPTDNGYKVYTDGGIQIVSPTDREIEAAIAAAPPADEIRRVPVQPAVTDLVERYIARAAAVRRGTGSVRVALTPLHGVGGAAVVEALQRAGFGQVHTVGAQFAPDPDFPTVAFPNPEEPGATDALLTLAAEVAADVAIALDPDADRCAVGVPAGSGWRMLSGDETGWLLGDYILSRVADPRAAVVASTVVSSRMLAAIARRYGATHVETLTGFKWLARADADLPGGTLVYAYEEAIGHCVDPDAVRDKDGISAAVLVCDLVAALKDRGRSVSGALDELARRYGVHDVAAVSRRVADAAEAAELMRRLRETPPETLAGFTATVTDIADALIVTGGDDDASVRLVVRPSGTEPKMKCYIEVRCAVTGELDDARQRARAVRDELVSTAQGW
ncbi:phospho-sugar mutase [Mycobacterium paraffinicum]|uniref:Phospho-sugar mutase n=1 Tax=Mycobacterium paraffinicum TaxID=53378 RepID=A0ABP8F2F2_9MYCO|nr:phospho-sugar mutase [Mycobacterium paraffinicum]MCV7311869.1 phospho-sugar mutase [Mycobacterium paraffinicum]